MDKINTIIIDDDNALIETLTKQLSFFPFISLMGSFNSYLMSKELIATNTVDLVFLDIMLKDENGLDIAEAISSYDKRIKIIFITSQPDFALEGYKVGPFDFITKPINPIRLDKTLMRLKDELRQDHPYTTEDVRIGIKVGSSIELIKISSIDRVEKKLRKVEVSLSSGEIISCGNSLKDLESKLRIHGFVSISRTLLLPLRAIKKIDYNKYEKFYEILLQNSGEKIRISKDKYRSLKDALKDFNWII